MPITSLLGSSQQRPRREVSDTRAEQLAPREDGKSLAEIARGGEEVAPPVQKGARKLEARPKLVVLTDFQWNNSQHNVDNLRTGVQDMVDKQPPQGQRTRPTLYESRLMTSIGSLELG